MIMESRWSVPCGFYRLFHGFHGGVMEGREGWRGNGWEGGMEGEWMGGRDGGGMDGREGCRGNGWEGGTEGEWMDGGMEGEWMGGMDGRD